MWRFLAGPALLLMGALAGVAPAAAQTTLKVGPAIVPRVLDPHHSTAVPTRHFGYLVFDTLFGIDSKFDARPQMVESYTVSSDRLLYTFTLRPGLTWHDGKPVTAADCVASLRRWWTRDPGGQVLAKNASALEVVNARTFRLELREPSEFVLYTLAKTGAPVPFMMPERIAKTPISEPISEIVGSGPYRFRADLHNPGERIVLDRFEGYVPRPEPTQWTAGGKIARTPRIELLNVPKGQAQVNALLKGDLDFIEEMPFDHLPLVDNSKVAQSGSIMLYGEQAVLRLNHLQPPFDSLTVRQAVAHAIDRKRYADVVAGDPRFATPCAAIFGCKAPYSSEEGIPAHDLQQARAYLRTAGVDFSKPIVMLHVTDAPPITAMGGVTRQILQELGFTVQVVSLDFQTFVLQRTNPGPPAQGGWHVAHTTFGIGDQFHPLSNPFLVAVGYPDGQWGWPKDPETELLKLKFAAATDFSERLRIAELIQTRAYEQVLYLPVAQFLPPSAWRNNVDGALKSPVLLLYNLEKK